jgi:ABC-type nitrate/sulfonate/bicarbonate transport system permease component
MGTAVRDEQRAERGEPRTQAGSPPQRRTSRWKGLRRAIVPPAAVLVVLLVVWESAVRLLDLPTYLLPSPSAIAASFSGEWSELARHTRATAISAVLGYIIGNGVALVLAAVMAEFRPVENALYPWMLALRSLPVVALAPLLIIWFGFTIWPIVAATALICFFPTLVNGIQGFKSTDDTTLQLMRGLNASRSEVFRLVKLPTAAPMIFAALKISVASALVGAVVGEWISSKVGLGYLTIVASNYVDTLLLFRAIVAVAVIAIVWFLIIQALESWALRWQRTGR